MRHSLDDGQVAARKGAKRAAPAPRLRRGEFVAYPGGPTAVYDLLERLAAVAGDSPDAGTHGISLDRTRLVVRWFGDLPDAVQAVLRDAGGVEVTVQQTEFRPGDLATEADRLVAEHRAVVAAATPRPEGDGIEVLVWPAVAETAGGAEQALAGVVSAHPLFAEIGEPPPR
jgi:hypothetical protein